MKDGRVGTQALLVPIVLSPDSVEIAAASEHKEALVSIGFIFEINARSIEISAIPDMIDIDDAASLFENTLSDLSSGLGDAALNDSIRQERALYQVACKAAIKGGRAYGTHVVDWLVKKVLSLPDITVCPHGRPIAYKLTKRELDRQFDRIK